MTLTPDERKRKLGFGGLTKIAKRTRRTLGHVSQVNAGKREDPKVMRAIASEIVRAHPDIAPSEVWPESTALLAS